MLNLDLGNIFSKPVFNTSQNPIVKFSQNAISHPEKTGFSVGVFAEPLPNLIKFPQVLKVSLGPFIFSEDTISHLTPKCKWKTKYNRQCPLCGMTKAFILISQGNINEALKSNNSSFGLYILFIFNEIAFLFSLFRIEFSRKVNS